MRRPTRATVASRCGSPIAETLCADVRFEIARTTEYGSPSPNQEGGGDSVNASRKIIRLLAATIALSSQGHGHGHSPCGRSKHSSSPPLAERRSRVAGGTALLAAGGPFPPARKAEHAASAWSLVAESAGSVWLFTLGPAGGFSASGTKVSEVGPIPRVASRRSTSSASTKRAARTAARRPCTHILAPEAFFRVGRRAKRPESLRGDARRSSVRPKRDMVRTCRCRSRAPGRRIFMPSSCFWWTPPSRSRPRRLGRECSVDAASRGQWACPGASPSARRANARTDLFSWVLAINSSSAAPLGPVRASPRMAASAARSLSPSTAASKGATAGSPSAPDALRDPRAHGGVRDRRAGR